MTQIGKPFKSLDAYNNAMSQAINDKLFFLNHLPQDDYLYVDFGCADGALLNRLKSLVSGTFIGYDLSEEMLHEAELKNPDMFFTNRWNDVLEKMDTTSKKKVLILSSVIHEVYSYADSLQDITEFWQKVNYSGFDYVVVRDMIPSQSINRPAHWKHRFCVELFSDAGQLTEFEHNFGTIHNNKNLVHFLLKYRYKINWKREVNENYFPLYKEKFLKKFPSFEQLYVESFKVPFLVKQIKKDFGLTLQDDTHLKAIFYVKS